MNEIIIHSCIGVMMTKSFSNNEKEFIRSSLIKHGKDLFTKYGLKRTGITELTKAAGISQGSFYVFFNSKEELYFEILEMEEEKLADTLRDLFNSEKLTKTSFRKFLSEYFILVHGNPFIENLIKHKEYELVMRKLPDDKKNKHLQNESIFLKSMITPLMEDGSLKMVKPEILSGLFHALFLLQLHKKEIGTGIFPEIMELIIDLLTEGLVMK